MSTDEYVSKDDYPCFVQVTDDETLENVIELPTEKDGTILLSTVQAQYPTAIGLKYRSSSGAWRGVRLSDNVLDPPYEGWGTTIYHIALPKTDSVKRKMEESPNREPEAKLVKTGSESDFLSDLIVLGLPYKATENDLKEYFQQFGELAMHEVKYDPVSKESRGFGFIRYKNVASAQKVLKMNHSILGRRCEVRMPKKKDEIPLKLFVGRLGDNISDEDLRKYFSTFGDLTDVYIPSPFRGFGFVTFASADVAKQVLHMNHSLKDSRLNVTFAEPKGETKSLRGSNDLERDRGRDRDRNREHERDRDRGDHRDRDHDRGRRSQDPPFDFEDMRQFMYNNSRQAGYNTSTYSASAYTSPGYNSHVSSRESRSAGSARDISGNSSSRGTDSVTPPVPPPIFNPYMSYPNSQGISYPSQQYGSYWSPAANK